MMTTATERKQPEQGVKAMRFSDVDIYHFGLRPNGTEFQIIGIDESDQTIMDEFGTWYDFADCDFPRYEK